MFVFTARRIRPERGNAAAIGNFDRLRVPRARRTVSFGRNPLFDVPAIDRRIFRLLAQLDDFAKQRSGTRIVLLEFSADPRKPIPSPHGAIIWRTEWIATAGEFERTHDGLRWLVRLAQNDNAWRAERKERRTGGVAPCWGRGASDSPPVVCGGWQVFLGCFR